MGGGDLSVDVVEEALEETLSQVQIADRINGLCESHGPGKLAVPVAPMVLNAFHVPLVHNYDYPLPFASINSLEEVFIALVNEYLLHFGEENIGCLNIPVDEVLV